VGKLTDFCLVLVDCSMIITKSIAIKVTHNQQTLWALVSNYEK
jgi:hypothetical protein